MRSRLVAALVVLIVTPAVFAAEIVIKAAKVYTQTGATLAPGAVLVKDGKIAEVAATITVTAGVQVIDLGEGVVLPGLIDAHTAIGVEGGMAESTLEVTPGFRVLDAVDMSSRAIRRARAEGVTTLRIVPGTENVIAGLSCIVKSAGAPAQRVVSATDALVITLASDPGSGNSSRNRPDSIYTRQPTNRMGVVWILRHEFGTAQMAKNPGSILGSAVSGTRPVVCVSRTDSDMVAALRLRQEYPMAMVIAGGQEAYKVRTELAKSKTALLLEPLATTPGAGPEGTETILNLAGTLHESGIDFAITGGKLLDQARMAARFGLPKDVAMSAITSAPARLLGLGSRLGTIAIGRDADLVALSGDPFDLSTTIRWTMIDGVIRAEEP